MMTVSLVLSGLRQVSPCNLWEQARYMIHLFTTADV